MRRQTFGTLAIIAALTASGAPVSASEPEPVIKESWLPADGPTEPYQDRQAGRCPAGTTRMGPGGGIELSLPRETNLMPGPVYPLEAAPAPGAAPCLADVRLDLLIEAADDKKPDGADGNLDGIAVSRSSLEGGFEVTLPAADRLITLSDPGDNWELKSTSCSCSGWTTLTASGGSSVVAAPAPAMAYPQPVIKIPPPPPGGPGGCSGSAPVVIGPFTSRPAAATSAAPSELTAYPAPVLPLARLQAPRLEWDENGTVTITDPDRVGGTFTCVWTVELLYGQLDVETVTTPAGEEGRFRYRLEPTGGQPEATAFTVRGSASERLRWGPWSVELVDPPEGWKVERSSCSEADTSLISLADGPSASVGLDGDDAVRCTFELELLAPKPGRWTSSSSSGRVVCSNGGASFPVDLSPSFDRLRMQVRNGGDRLVVRAEGQRFVFRRDRDDPLRYVGTKRLRRSGITLDWDIRLDLRSETRMTGTVRGTAKGLGATCRIRESLVLTHGG